MTDVVLSYYENGNGNVALKMYSTGETAIVIEYYGLGGRKSIVKYGESINDTSMLMCKLVDELQNLQVKRIEGLECRNYDMEIIKDEWNTWKIVRKYE